MIASDFEYRHRFWFIALVFVLAYSLYNLDHVNVVYAVLPSNKSLREWLIAIWIPGIPAGCERMVGNSETEFVSVIATFHQQSGSGSIWKMR